MAGIKTLGIIDPFWEGHSPSYFVMYWRILSGKQSASGQHFKLVGFSPQPEQTKQMLLDYGFANACIWPLKLSKRTKYPKTLFGNARFAIANWRSLKRAVVAAESETGPIDFAINLWLDPFLASFVPKVLVDTLFPKPWVGLYIMPMTFRIRQSRRWRLLEKFFPRYGPVKAGKCQAIFTFDEGTAVNMAAATKKLVLAVPDVADATAPDQNDDLAGLIKKKSGRNQICAMIGVLCKRKGLITLIEAAKARPPGWFFVFAGGFAETDFPPAELETIKQFINSNPENSIFWLKYLPTEASFNAVVSACDVLYANYPWYPFSSGIVSKGALFKKPVIVSNRFLLAERVARYQIGWGLPEENVDALVDLLTHTDRQAVEAKRLQARFEDYCAEHSEARLSTLLDQLFVKVGI
ncbi:MAG TPA: glycosyltransferase [Verrucomicrobiae bacterium]